MEKKERITYLSLHACMMRHAKRLSKIPIRFLQLPDDINGPSEGSLLLR
jgi:hypothetical protein